MDFKKILKVVSAIDDNDFFECDNEIEVVEVKDEPEQPAEEEKAEPKKKAAPKKKKPAKKAE